MVSSLRLTCNPRISRRVYHFGVIRPDSTFLASISPRDLPGEESSDDVTKRKVKKPWSGINSIFCSDKLRWPRSFLQWSDMRVKWERADLCGLTVGGWMVSLTALLAQVLFISAVEWPACGVGEGRSLWSDGGWVDGQPDSASGSGTGHFCSGVTCVWSGRGQISVVWQWVGGWSAWQCFWLGY